MSKFIYKYCALTPLIMTPLINIHLNPVRARILDNPESYKWSSCSLYYKNELSELVDPTMVLEYAGGVDNYKFILAEMMEDSPPPEAVYGKFSILGQAAFKEKVLRQIDDTEISRKGVLEYKRLKSADPDKIAEIVMKLLKVPTESLVEKTNGNTARKLYLYLLKKHTTLKVVEIAEIAGMNSTAAGELIRRFGREITKSKELTSILNNSEKLLHE